MATSTTTVYVNFNNDGSWNFTFGTHNHTSTGMTGTNYYDTYTSAGGYWHISPGAGAGNAYEVYFAVADATAGIAESTSSVYLQRRALAGQYAIGGVAFTTWHTLAANRQIYLTMTNDYPSFGTQPTGTILAAQSAMTVTAYVRSAGGGGQQVGQNFGPIICENSWNRNQPSGGGGGGGGCVHYNSHVRWNQRAIEVVEGDYLRAMRAADDFDVLPVTGIRLSPQPCYRITMTTGASLVLSHSTPLTMRDNSMKMMPELVEGDELPVYYETEETVSEPFWDTVASIEDVGEQLVTMISVNGHSYAAGEKRGAYIYTHNTGNSKT